MEADTLLLWTERNQPPRVAVEATLQSPVRAQIRDHSMTTRCPCCGQSVSASAIPTIWVEEEVLSLCNRAYDRADEAGAAEVELRHVIEVLDADPSARAFLASIGVDDRSLIDAARRSPVSGLAGSGERPRTSAGLRTLLQRAEVRARSGGHQSIAVDLFLAALLLDMRDVAAAAFIPQAMTQRAAQYVAGASAGEAHAATWHARQLQLPLHRPQAERDRQDGARNRFDRDQNRLPWRGDDNERAATSANTSYQRQPTDGVRAAGIAHENSPLPPRERDREMDRLLGRFDAQSRLLARLQSQLEAVSSELGINTRGHRRFFRKRRSPSALLRHFRRRASSSNGNGVRPARPRARAVDTALIDADPIELETEDDADDDTPLAARPKRFYLALEDDIVKAPSIGPRTASKFIAVGATLVRDLLLADPEELSAALQTRYITPQRVAAWQAQARLVCTIPWLRGTHAQMLVGAGFDTLDKVQRADRDKLCAAVLQFAGTRDGQSVLRSQPPPENARIVRWAEFAQLAERDRAGQHAYRH